MASFHRLRTKLDDLDRQDPLRRRHGADKHQYRVNDPLPLSVVEGLEARCGTRLPDEYRRFVAEFGDGGAGPGYGILRLADAVEELFGYYDEDEPGYRQLLSDPFPAPQTVGESRELDWPARGILPVSHIGSGSMHVLVVSGRERGSMWRWTNDSLYWPVPSPADRPQYSKNSPEESRVAAVRAWERKLLSAENRYRATLLMWYEDWIDHSLRAAGAHD